MFSPHPIKANREAHGSGQAPGWATTQCLPPTTTKTLFKAPERLRPLRRWGQVAVGRGSDESRTHLTTSRSILDELGSSTFELPARATVKDGLPTPFEVHDFSSLSAFSRNVRDRMQASPLYQVCYWLSEATNEVTEVSHSHTDVTATQLE